MKANLKSVALGIITIIAIASCGKKQTGVNVIPKNALVAGAIDINSLEKKLLQDSMTFDAIVKGFTSGQTDSSLKKAFDKYTKFKNAGIDISSKVYFSVFVSKNGGPQLLSLNAAVLDRKKLEAFVREEGKDELAESKKGAYTIFKNIKKGDNAVGISDNNIIVIGFIDSYSEFSNRKSAVSLEDELTRLFELKPSETLADNKHFKELEKEQVDGFFYSNVENNPQFKAFTSLGKLNELLKDLQAGGTFNFEKGKVVVNTKTWANDKLGAVLTKHAGNVVNIGAVEKFPVKALNGFFCVNFKPALITDILKEAGIYEEIIAGARAQLSKSFNLDPLVIQKAIAGEMNVVVGDYDPAKGEASQGTLSGITAFNGMLELKVGDKAAFAQIMDTLMKKSLVAKDASGNYVVTMFAADPEFPLGISITDQHILLTSNKALLTTYNSASTTTLPADIKGEASNSSTMLYVDAQTFLNKLINGLNSSQDTKPAPVAEALKSIVFTIGNYKGDVLNAKFEMYMNNANQNALPVIVKAAMAQKKSDDDRRAKLMNEMFKNDPVKPLTEPGAKAEPVPMPNVAPSTK